MVDWFYNPYAILFFAFMICWIFYGLAILHQFNSNKNSFYIRMRNPKLIFVSAIGQFFMIVAQCLKIIVEPRNFSNFADHLFLWFLLPLHFVPYPIRAIQFFIKYQISKAYADKEEAEENEQRDYSEYWIKLSEHQKYFTDGAFLLYSFILIFISLVFGIFRLFMYSDNLPGHYGYGVGKTSYIVSLILFVIILLPMIVFYIIIKDAHDEINVDLEIFIITVTWIICVPLFIGFGYGSLVNPSIPPEISPIFDIILCIISFMASFAMPVALAKIKNPNFKSTIPTFKNIDAILQDPVAYKMLRTFMQKNACSESLLFLNEVKKFQLMVDPVAIRVNAQRIYNKFIPLHAPQEINISGKLKREIENKLFECAVTIFDPAVKEIKKMINIDQIPRFINSEEMIQYIKKLKTITLNENTTSI